MTSPVTDSSYAYTLTGLYLGSDGISMRFVGEKSLPGEKLKCFICNKSNVKHKETTY